MSLPGAHGLFTTNSDFNEDEHKLAVCTSRRACSTYNISPISKLPNEILSYIFVMNLEPGRFFSLRCQAQESTISASQVCRHWRAVALSCAILWATIMDFESDSHEWAQELLGRTKQVPFNVGNSKIACIPKNLNLILDFCSRWKTFNIQVDTLTEELLYAIQKPAPSLEMFGILLNQDGQDATTLPSMLFGGTAPKLREVRLYRCCFDITTSVFSELTSLEVIWIGGFVGPTVSEWLQLLNNIPQLEKLHISRAIYKSTITEPLPRVELPQLWDLSLGACMAECSRFLTHINIPPLARFSLSIYELRPHPDFQVILKFLEERIDRWARDIVSSEYVAFLQPHSFWVSSDPYSQDLSHPSVQITFDWEGFIDNEPTDRSILFAHPFIRLFSPLLHKAQLLCMHYPVDEELMHSVPAMTLALNLLYPFYNIVTLHLSGGVHISLFPLLERVHMIYPGALGSSNVMLPSLQVLEFNRSDFKKDDECGLNTLWTFLQFRSDNGIEIKKIKFSYCNVTEEQENAMKEFGVDVSSFYLNDFQLECVD